MSATTRLRRRILSASVDAGSGETKDGYYQPLEKAELVRSGRDVTILCYSRMRYVVMQAVAELEKHGYDPEVGANVPGSTDALSAARKLVDMAVCLSTNNMLQLILTVAPRSPCNPCAQVRLLSHGVMAVNSST